MTIKHQEHWDEWIRLYQGGASFGQIARQYGTSTNVVWHALKNRGVNGRPGHQEKREVYDQYATEWVSLYRDGVSALEIARRYNVPHLSSVVERLEQAGVTLRSRSEATRKYYIENEGAFETLDSEEAAYWFGFLIADGSIIGQKRESGKTYYRLSFGLSWHDQCALDRFQKFIGTEYPYTETVRQRKKTDEAVAKVLYLNVTSDHLIGNLVRHGCVPNKTLIVKWPETLPDSMVRHFIRGNFDGDGSIALKATGHATAQWTSGSVAFLEAMNDKLVKLAGLPPAAFCRSKASKACTLNYYSRGNLLHLFHWMYADATVFLERKKSKFEEFLFGGNPLDGLEDDNPSTQGPAS